MKFEYGKDNEPSTASRIVSEKGQTVIPKAFRDYMDIQTGDRVQWIIHESGAVTVKPIKRKSIKQLQGVLKTQYAVSDLEEELQQARNAHYGERSARGGLQGD
jgi:AbrB family looped-hinge helix DNA binding protein